MKRVNGLVLYLTPAGPATDGIWLGNGTNTTVPNHQASNVINDPSSITLNYQSATA